MSGFKFTIRRYCWVAALLTILVGCEPLEPTVQFEPPATGGKAEAKVLFLAGPDSHLPGAHEHEDGSLLLATALRERQPTWETINVYGGWPPDASLLQDVDAIVMYCDGGEAHLINEQLDTFNRLIHEGVGIVALHYCVEVPKGSAAASSMLNAIGGYFETWWSVNPHWVANYTALPEHPISTGIKPFSLDDEWYFNMRFVGQGVTPILAAVAPASTMDRSNGPHSGNDSVRESVAAGASQVTTWAYERPGGGRGFGYTGGHHHANWENAEARNLVLNAIEWVTLKP